MRRLSRPILALALAIGCSTPALSPAPRAPLPTRAPPEQEARAALLLTGPEWYRHAVFYEVYVRSFADANGDGIGDLAGLTSKLDYLKALGIDAIWLMPIMPTAFKDSGYDVSDYRSVNPEYGDLAAFDALVAAAHARKMRVMIDLVLNHTASNHAWFQESRSSKTNPKADWYVWSDTPARADIGCGTAGPTFGDSAWTYEPARGQWYFHRFYPDQPDLNYRNPAVIAETLDTARSWLARGVDGFRCDVIGMLFERADGCDMVPETVDYIKRLRAVLDEFPDRTMVSESSLANAAPYLGTGRDMFPMTFDFQYGYLWNLAFAAQNRQIVYKALEDALTTYPPGAQDASLVGSHDVARAYTRANGLEWRHRRAAEISMFMKATPFVYYGDELGLRPGAGVVVDTRDSARTPMPWTRAEGHGFSTSHKPWIPFGDLAAETSVEAEDADLSSMLTFYRQLLAFRRGHAVWGTGDMKLVPIDNGSILAFVRRNELESYLVLESFAEDAADGDAPSDGVGAIGELMWGDGAAKIDAGRLHVSLPPGGSAVFKTR